MGDRPKTIHRTVNETVGDDHHTLWSMRKRPLSGKPLIGLLPARHRASFALPCDVCAHGWPQPLPVFRAKTLSVGSASCSILLVCTIHASASDSSRKPGIRVHLPLRLVISTPHSCPFWGITRYAMAVMLHGTMGMRAFRTAPPMETAMFLIWLAMPTNVR